MKTLPDSAVHYKSTPVFTVETVPAALLRSHTTTAGSSGLCVFRSTFTANFPHAFKTNQHKWRRLRMRVSQCASGAPGL